VSLLILLLASKDNKKKLLLLVLYLLAEDEGENLRYCIFIWAHYLVAVELRAWILASTGFGQKIIFWNIYEWGFR
jgi:hypothetical protein